MKRSASESKTTKTQNIEVKQSYPVTIVAKKVVFKDDYVLVVRYAQNDEADKKVRIKYNDFLFAREYHDTFLVVYLTRKPQPLTVTSKVKSHNEHVLEYEHGGRVLYVNKSKLRSG